jgi:hypothetical protein
VVPSTGLVVRVGSAGAYTADELETYRDYVRCGGTLVLLSDGKAPGEADALAEAFGWRVGGVVQGEAVVDRWADHPATRGLAPLSMPGGSGLLAWDDRTEILGRLSAGSYLDLNGNQQLDPDEPSGAPALALEYVGRGAVVFLGTTAVIGQADSPLLGQLLRHLLPQAPWFAADAAEPDDTPATARPLPLDGQPRERSLYPAGDFDWVAFPLESGQRVQLTVQGYCDSLSLTLYAPDRTTVVARLRPDSPEDSLRFTARQAGVHYLRVAGSSQTSRCASYQLSGSVEGLAPRPSEAPRPAPVQVPRPAPVQLPRSDLQPADGALALAISAGVEQLWNALAAGPAGEYLDLLVLDDR